MLTMPSALAIAGFPKQKQFCGNLQAALPRTTRPFTRSVCCRAQNDSQATPDRPQPGRIPYSLVSGLAAIGAAETTYLTLVKLLHTPLVCPTSGCEAILDSDYSSLFGVPLSFLGALTYGAVGILSAIAAQKQDQDSDSSSSSTSGQIDSALLCGVTLLGSCSTALVYILNTQFPGETCAWCYLSAGLSFSLLAAVVSGMGLSRLRASAAPGAGALMLSCAVLYFGLGGVGSSNASGPTELPYAPSPVTTASTRQAVTLARQLKDAGAKMYGAFWCSHCFEQKQTFGKEAMSSFPYVECFPDGWKRGIRVAEACSDADVRAFPTWVINGRNVEGELTLEAIQKELDTPVGQPSPNIPVEEEETVAE